MNVNFLEDAQQIPAVPTLKVHSTVPVTVDSSQLHKGVKVKCPSQT